MCKNIELKFYFFCFTHGDKRNSPMPLPRARCSMETPPPQPKKANPINRSIRYDTSNRIMECVCACRISFGIRSMGYVL